MVVQRLRAVGGPYVLNGAAVLILQGATALMVKLDIPVKYICVGEQVEDLEEFNADDFVRALFD